MKIKNSRDEEIPLSAVAELEALDKADTFIDPCRNSAIAVLATDENLAKAEAQLNKDASSVVVPPRPSLEVETEVHSNLIPRIEAHLARMRAWDMRKLDQDTRLKFIGAMDALANSTSEISTLLDYMRTTGFEAKTTPATRIAAKLQRGTKVYLRDDQRSIFSKVYSDEQLDSLSVVKATDTHVQLMAEDGSNLGLVKLIHVTVKL